MNTSPIRVLIVVGAVATGLTMTRPAVAGGCNGSSDSSSSSSSDSSSDDWDDEDYGPTCVDESGVLGMTACSEYGSGWAAMPPIRVRQGIEVAVRHITQSQTIEIDHDDDTHVVAVGAKMLDGGRGVERIESNVPTAAYALEAGIVLADHLTLAVGGSIGGSPSPDVTAINQGGAGRVEVDSLFTGSGWLALGALLPLGDFNLWTDVRAGGGFTTLNLTSYVADCVATGTWETNHWLLDFRAGADWFMTPHVSLGAWAGASPIAENPWGGGATFTVHIAPYDGVDPL